MHGSPVPVVALLLPKLLLIITQLGSVEWTPDTRRAMDVLELLLPHPKVHKGRHSCGRDPKMNAAVVSRCSMWFEGMRVTVFYFIYLIFAIPLFIVMFFFLDQKSKTL